MVRSFGRWTAKTLRVAALTGAVALTENLYAQLPTVPSAPPVTSRPQPTNAPANAGPRKIYTKTMEFKLPIQMEPETRNSLREVRLFVKSGGGDWVQQEVALPTATHFLHRVPQDGEYWFTLVTVDKAGRQDPANINAAPPALRVVVDTRPPVIETAHTNEYGDHLLRVNVVDANPDPQSVRAVVLTEAGERALSPMPNQPGVFRLSSADLSAPIRVTASDLSGNLASKDLPPANGNAVTRTEFLPPIAGSGIPTPPPPTTLPSGPSFAGGTQMPQVPPMPSGTQLTTAYRPHVDQSDKPSNRKLINSTHAQVEYRVDTVGPSGIGRIDVYVTQDRGQSWTKLCEDTNKRSPADIELPGEGIFGIRLALTNGNGFGGKAPHSGDRPQFWIEVDSTSPTVQLLPYELVPGANAIDFRWSASDPNLGADPVSIFFRTRPEASWTPIARNIKNDGVYRWVFPRDIGGQVYYKIEVTDMAGNMTKVETPTPIMLDQTEPEVTLVDIVGVRSPGATLPTTMPGTMPPTNMTPPNMAPPSVPPMLPTTGPSAYPR
jgi:hypothetical protein